MNKEAVIKFFDKCSSNWDKNMITDDYKMNEILNSAKIKEGMSVLDIACGTGVMFSYYKKRGVKSITGVDISGEMIKICQSKYKEQNEINVICADAESYHFKNTYDACMVFNAFPHFVNPYDLISNLCSSIKTGGTLTVAHDRGRKELDIHHSKYASDISNGLMSETELGELFKNAGLKNIYTKATSSIYIVSGTK